MAQRVSIGLSKSIANKIEQPQLRIKPVIENESSTAIVNKSSNDVDALVQTAASESENQEITLEQVKKLWPEIIAHLHREWPRVHNILKQISVNVVGDQIQLLASADHIQNAITERLIPLTHEARKILKNSDLSIGFDINIEEKKERSLYLIKDKFKFYNEKNPNLKFLVEQFGLEL